MRSGSPEREIKWDEKLTGQVIDRLVKHRLYASQIDTGDTRGSNLPDKGLSLIDKLVLDDELGTRLDRRVISGKDVFLANRVILNELILTQLAIARVARRDPSFFNGVKDYPLIGRLANIGTTDLEGLGIPAQNLDRFIEVYGIGNWRSGREAENQIRDLFGIYMRMEKSFYRNGIRDPIVDQLRDHIPFFGRMYHDPIFDERNGMIVLPRVTMAPIPPPADRPGQIANISRETGQIPHDEFVRQVRNAIEDRATREMPGFVTGMSFEQVFLANPVEAFRILYDANQAAAAQESTEAVKRILSRETYSPTKADLEAQRDRLKQPPTDEDIQRLDDEVFRIEGEKIELEGIKTDRETDARLASEKIDALTQELASARTEQRTLRKTLIEVQAETARTIPNLVRQVERERGNHARLLRDEAVARRNANKIPDPAQKALELGRIESQYRDQIRNALKTFNDSSSSLAAERGKVDKARRILAAQGAIIGHLTIEVNNAKNRKDTTLAAQRAAIEDLRLKQRELDQKTAEKTKATAQKTNKEHVGNSDEIDAMDRQIDIRENRSSIYEIQYSQREGDPFTTANLVNAELTREGEIFGTERIRELIIQAVNKAKWNPELARKMLSDETIARGLLIWFGIELTTNVTIPLPPGALGPPPPPTTFNNLLEEVQTRRDALEFLPANQTQKRADLEREIREREIAATQAVLRHVSGKHRAFISSAINFLVDEGLRSAEQGKPFLNFVR